MEGKEGAARFVLPIRMSLCHGATATSAFGRAGLTLASRLPHPSAESSDPTGQPKVSWQRWRMEEALCG